MLLHIVKGIIESQRTYNTKWLCNQDPFPLMVFSDLAKLSFYRPRALQSTESNVAVTKKFSTNFHHVVKQLQLTVRTKRGDPLMHYSCFHSSSGQGKVA